MKLSLIFKKNAFVLLQLLVFVTLPLLSHGQANEYGTPLIQNIPPKFYGYESQNFSITQDDQGILYIGNLSGVLKFDGSQWDLIKITGAPALTKASDGKIFVGGFDEFGFLNTDMFGKTEFISLTNKMELQHRNFGVVGRLFPYKKDILFYTQKQIFRWSPASDQIELIDSSDTFIKVFNVDGDLYAFKHGVGLLQYDGNNFTMVVEGDYFSDMTILSVMPYTGNKLLVVTANPTRLYVYSNQSIDPIRTPVTEYLTFNKFTYGVRLSNGNYALGTSKCGLVIMTPEGNTITTVNRANGLHDDDIKDIFIDRVNNLWLATNNGLSRVEIPNAFSYFDRSFGFKGGVKAITRHNGLLYIATTQGLFYMDTLPPQHLSCSHYYRFFPVTGIEADGNAFFKNGNNLFLSTDAGLYKINGINSSLVFEGIHEKIVKSRIDSTVFYCGREDGLVRLALEKNQFVYKEKLMGLRSHIRTIVEEENGNLWLGTNYSGVYLVEFPDGWDNNAKIFHFDKGYGLPHGYDWIDVYNSETGILFSTAKGLYRFNSVIRRFQKDTLLGVDLNKSEAWLYPIVQAKDGRLWFSSGHSETFEKITGYAAPSENDKYNLVTAEFSKIKSFTVEGIYPESNDIAWFATFDGVIRYDKKELSRNNLNVPLLLTSVRVNQDSLLPLPHYRYIENKLSALQVDSLVPSLAYGYNSFYFSFASPSYESGTDIQYSCYLEGFEKTWSEWSSIHNRDYTNLQEGNFCFKIRAKDIYGNISNELNYYFIINPPFYRTWYAFIIYLILSVSFLLMVIKYRNYLFEKEKHNLERIIADRTEELVKQKERAEELVSNILPKQTAEELKSEGRSERRKYKMVTVLFSNIHGFSVINEEASPDQVIDDLEKSFKYFDNVVDRLNIEKVKTIGDTYMCAGGIPAKNRTNPIDVVMAALEMRNHLKDVPNGSGKKWDLRIGIHSGPVIAGVVGSKKISYDIWGETVNIASRMEASGAIGEINISDITYELVHQYFECELKGKIPVKHKGEIGMYIVKGLKPEFATDNTGKEPNSKFLIKLQMIRFDDLEELIMTKLDKGLPKNLYYHNMKHSIDVLNMVEVIGRRENVTEEEMLLLKTAALFHDAGFLIGYDEHELLGIKMANEILPDFSYSEEQIKIVSELIYSTKLPPEPKNLLESIMCDADLDYLGRTDFIPVSQNLFRELYEHGKIKSIDEWNKLQVKFISSHNYFTQAARDLRDNNKQMQLEKIKSMI